MKNIPVKPLAVELINDLPEATLETILRSIPVLNIAYNVFKKQDERFKEACLLKLIGEISKDVKSIESKFDNKWLDSLDGKKFCMKLINIATNGEHAEKIEWFAHAFVNSVYKPETLVIDQKYKFTDILKNLSLIDIAVLVEIYKNYNIYNKLDFAREVELEALIKKLENSYNPYLIEAAFVNLVNNVVLSKVKDWIDTDSDKGKFYQAGDLIGDYTIAYYTPFTAQFVEFISRPINTN